MITLKNILKKGLLWMTISGGMLVAQTNSSLGGLSDDPVAAMLDSLASEKALANAFNKPMFPKNNKYKFASDSVPRYDDFVYESRLAKLDASSPFDLVYNPHVKGFIDLYTVRRRELVSRMMGLAQLYYPMFEEILDRKNMPLELKHLAVIESALNPNARSKAGAVGLWQFMYPTGKLYGLNVTSYVDERSDVYKATEAAANYLQALYNMFGDWQMVLAAYNAGPGTISKAIRRSGGKKTYWEIRPYLPLETQAYVPAFIAANYVMNYTAEHNIYISTPRKSYFEVDTAVVKEPITFEQLSEALDVPVEEIKYFNPQYRKNIIPAGGHMMTLPKAKIGMFITNEQDIYAAVKAQKNEDNVLATVKEVQKTHVVKSGEKLSTIARKYGVTVADIKSWNYIGKKGIRPGKKLVIYVKQNETVTPPLVASNKNNLTKKDSVSASVNDVKKLAENKTSSKTQTHTVKKGETLYQISKKYGMTVQELMDMNGMNKNSNLQYGQKLKVKLVS